MSAQSTPTTPSPGLPPTLIMPSITEHVPQELELIFHGTGTSSGLPLIECLVARDTSQPCVTCCSSLTPSGKKNARRNTGGIVRARGKQGQTVTIVIDVGKTFLSAALEWFPKYGLSRIDAVLITHGHADAMNGLDDLRGWTLQSAIQSHVDIYLTQDTFEAVNRCFPYLVNKKFASGGGDIPDFQWHIIDPNVPFEICGVSVLPFSVEHGRYFTDSCVRSSNSTPTASMPIPPLLEKASLQLPSPPDSPVIAKKPLPYMSLGFAIARSICWISDVSAIPHETWEILTSEYTGGRNFEVLVIDCLGIDPHTSHFGLSSSVATAAKLKAARTFLIGFSHDIPHEAWTRICEAIEGDASTVGSDLMSDMVREGLRVLSSEDIAAAPWIRPSYDGLQITIKDQQVKLSC